MERAFRLGRHAAVLEPRPVLRIVGLLRVENLSDGSELVQLRDRIPVSQTDQIRVSGVKVSPEGQPDRPEPLTAK